MEEVEVEELNIFFSLGRRGFEFHALGLPSCSKGKEEEKERGVNMKFFEIENLIKMRQV